MHSPKKHSRDSRVEGALYEQQIFSTSLAALAMFLSGMNLRLWVTRG